jgi:hypothetical protein
MCDKNSAIKEQRSQVSPNSRTKMLKLVGFLLVLVVAVTNGVVRELNHF